MDCLLMFGVSKMIVQDGLQIFFWLAKLEEIIAINTFNDTPKASRIINLWVTDYEEWLVVVFNIYIHVLKNIDTLLNYSMMIGRRKYGWLALCCKLRVVKPIYTLPSIPIADVLDVHNVWFFKVWENIDTMSFGCTPILPPKSLLHSQQCKMTTTSLSLS